VAALVRPRFAQDFRPQYPSISAAERQSEELMAVSDRHAVMNTRRVVVHGLLRFAHRHGGQHVNRITEDDG